MNIKQSEVVRPAKSSNEQEGGTDSKSSESLGNQNAEKDLDHNNFKFDVSGIKNFYKIFNLARYCRALGTTFLRFKKTFDSLPSDFEEDKYGGWMRQVLDVCTIEIPTFPAYFKLKKAPGDSGKMEVFLKSTNDLFCTKLRIGLNLSIIVKNN